MSIDGINSDLMSGMDLRSLALGENGRNIIGGASAKTSPMAHLQAGKDQASGSSGMNIVASSSLESNAAQTGLLMLNSGDNLMAGNFVKKNFEHSKYIQAQQAGAQAEKALVTRQNAILNAGIAELAALGEDAKASDKVRIGNKAARRMKEEQQHSVSEESERNLEENKEDIEQRAQEAVSLESADAAAQGAVAEADAGAGSSAGASTAGGQATSAAPGASINISV